MQPETPRSDGMDVSLVTNWEGRPSRTRKPPPKTYWEEFVATDAWYVRELVADVPPEELDAALCDEDWGDDEGDEEEGEEVVEDESEEEDPDYSEEDEEESDGADSPDEGSGESMATDDDNSSTDTGDVPTGGDGRESPPASPPATPRARPAGKG